MTTLRFLLVGSFALATAAIAACSSSDSASPSSVAASDGGVADAASSIDASACGVDPDAGARAVTFGETRTECITSDTAATYELTVPDGVAGGYIQLHLTNVVGSPVKVTVISLFDKSSLLETERFDDDAPVHGYLAVKGGTSYRITVERKQTYDDFTKYDLAVAYTPFVDAYEPNHALKEAKPISLSTDISASTLGPYEGKTTFKDENYWDWYTVNASAGPIAVKLTNPDPGVRYRVDLMSADGADMGTADSASNGADARLDRTIATAGTYIVRVSLFTYSFEMSGETEAVPPVYTTPYTLRVEQ